jgi:hypothetical protein
LSTRPKAALAICLFTSCRIFQLEIPVTEEAIAALSAAVAAITYLLGDCSNKHHEKSFLELERVTLKEEAVIMGKNGSKLCSKVDGRLRSYQWKRR